MGDYVRAFAQDSGYYVVYRNGVRVSDHTTERKAHSVAVNLVIEFPDDEIYYIHEYRVNVLRTNLSFSQTLGVSRQTNFNLSAASYTVDENSSINVTILRTIDVSKAQTVDWTVSNAAASPSSGSVSFAVDDTSKIVNITSGEVTGDQVGTFALQNPKNSDTSVPVPILGNIGSAVFTISDIVGSYESILDDREGWAKHFDVTGGQGGTLVTVTNLNNSGAGSLRQAIADASGPTWIKFTSGLTGSINLSSTLAPASDMTIDGRGADISIIGPGGSATTFGMTSGTIQNWIVMYIKFDGPFASNNDIIHIENPFSADPTGSTLNERFWFYHCNMNDGEDECFSYRRGSGKYTIQSCHLQNQLGTGQGVLLFNDDSANKWDDELQYSSWYRTFFDCRDRAPRLGVAGRHHVWNCYHLDHVGTAIFVNTKSGSGETAQGRLEGCIDHRADGSSAAFCKFAEGGQDSGYIEAIDILVLNGGAVNQNSPELVFDAPYTYTLASATTALRDEIIAEAGWQDVPFP